eukprot:scaffold239701_cov22-Tisochrysis_lutea.AAC.1
MAAYTAVSSSTMSPSCPLGGRRGQGWRLSLSSVHCLLALAPVCQGWERRRRGSVVAKREDAEGLEVRVCGVGCRVGVVAVSLWSLVLVLQSCVLYAFSRSSDRCLCP